MQPDSDQERLARHKTKTYGQHFQAWKENPVFCPFLGGEVKATRIGWEHIAGISKHRTPDDIHRRLDMLKYAREIVGKSGTCQEIRADNAGNVHYEFSNIVNFKGEYDQNRRYKKVRVIIRKTPRGDCLFYSVF
jgi:hypothetical protein